MGKTRRRVLTGGAIAVAGGGGYLLAQDDEKPKEIVDKALASGSGSLSTGPPPTETKIGETTDFDSQFGTGVPLKRIEFYESGAAIIHPKAERGECHEKFAILHESNDLGAKNDGDESISVDESDALGTWAFGDFGETITIDLEGTIASKDNYPDRQFKIRAYPTKGVCIAVEPSDTFQIPESYLPSNK